MFLCVCMHLIKIIFVMCVNNKTDVFTYHSVSMQLHSSLTQAFWFQQVVLGILKNPFPVPETLLCMCIEFERFLKHVVLWSNCGLYLTSTNRK